MAESLLIVGAVWLLHAVVAGLPAIAVTLLGKRGHWIYCILLLAVPFWALLLAQGIWPIGGMSSYSVRLIVLTVIVFVAVAVEVLPQTRRSPVWVHLVLVLIATLSVIPIQLLVPALSD